MYRPVSQYLVVGASAAIFLSACTTRPTPPVTAPTATVITAPARVATTDPSPAVTATSIPPSPAPTSTPSRALRDIKSGEGLVLVSEFPIRSSDYGVRMAFAPFEPILYHNGPRVAIEGYNFEAGEVVFQLPGFSGYSPLLLVLSDDGRLLAAENGTELGIWELSTGDKLTSLRIAPVFSPFYAGFLGIDAFWAADYTGNVAVWETGNWDETRRLDYWGNLNGVFVLPGSEAVAMLNRKGELTIVNWNGEVARSIPISAQWSQLLGLSPEGNLAMVNTNAGLYNEEVQVLNFETAEVSASFPAQAAKAFAVSDDWHLLAIADARQIVRFIDLESGQEFYGQELNALEIRQLAISPDGDYLAVYLLRGFGNPEGWIQIWAREPKP